MSDNNEEYYSDDDEYNITFNAPGASPAPKPTPSKSVPTPSTDLAQGSSTTPSAAQGGGLGIESISTLPEEDTSLFSADPNQYHDKPWRRPGADITDYFNYGFTEDTWLIYCQRQLEIKRAVRQGKPAPIRSLNPNQQGVTHDDVDYTDTTSSTTTRDHPQSHNNNNANPQQQQNRNPNQRPNQGQQRPQQQQQGDRNQQQQGDRQQPQHRHNNPNQQQQNRHNQQPPPPNHGMAPVPPPPVGGRGQGPKPQFHPSNDYDAMAQRTPRDRQYQ